MGAADPSREADDARRRRVTQAVCELASERGLRAVAGAEICLRAGISRADFERLFPTDEAALRHAFSKAFDRLFGPVTEAVTAAPTWLEGLANALTALLANASRQPQLAALCLIHSHDAPGASAGHGYRAAVDLIAAMLHPARVQAQAGAGGRAAVPVLAEEFLAHGILFQAIQTAERNEPAVVGDRHRDLLMLVLMTFYDRADAARMCGELES